jgi:hypothetical protein
MDFWTLRPLNLRRKTDLGDIPIENVIYDQAIPEVEDLGTLGPVESLQLRTLMALLYG